MEKPDFNYKHKPAFISFLLIYLFCFGISLWLIDSSLVISHIITKQIIMRLGVPRSNPLWNLPYGIVLSLPFLIYGFHKVLWNLMSTYEFNSSEIRLLTGSLSRKEHFFPLSDFFDISFKQNLIEIPFRVGCLIVNSRGGDKLIIKGVYNVRSVVEVLRSNLGVLY